MHKVTRYHDISCGHRVVGHETKCKFLHGHNYRIHFTCVASGLDSVGRVIDFSVIKSTLCEWLEANWDHKMLIWDKDEAVLELAASGSTYSVITESFIFVPFNPTAENMAEFLLTQVGPSLLKNTGVRLERVVIDETRKCSAEFSERRLRYRE